MWMLARMTVVLHSKCSVIQLRIYTNTFLLMKEQREVNSNANYHLAVVVKRRQQQLGLCLSSATILHSFDNDDNNNDWQDALRCQRHALFLGVQ